MLLGAPKARARLIMKTRILLVSLFVVVALILALAAIFIHIYVAAALLVLQILVLARSVWSYLNAGKKMAANDAYIAVNERTHPELYRLIQDTAAQMNVAMPVVYVIEERGINAYAFSLRLRTRAIAFTAGWLTKADPMATKGVIAHELAHVINRDALITALFMGVTKWGMVVPPRQQTGYVPYNQRTHPTTDMIFKVIFFIPRAIFQGFELLGKWLSRVREYLADLTAAERLEGSSAILNTLYFIYDMETGTRGLPMKHLWRSHPKTKDRIDFILDHTHEQAKHYN